jgi:hypothetical protein
MTDINDLIEAIQVTENDHDLVIETIFGKKELVNDLEIYKKYITSQYCHYYNHLNRFRAIMKLAETPYSTSFAEKIEIVYQEIKNTSKLFNGIDMPNFGFKQTIHKIRDYVDLIEGAVPNITMDLNKANEEELKKIKEHDTPQDHETKNARDHAIKVFEYRNENIIKASIFLGKLLAAKKLVTLSESTTYNDIMSEIIHQFNNALQLLGNPSQE